MRVKTQVRIFYFLNHRLPLLDFTCLPIHEEVIITENVCMKYKQSVTVAFVKEELF